MGHLTVAVKPMLAHESILVFSRLVGTYNPEMEEGEPYKGRRGIKDRKITRKEFSGSNDNVRNDNPTGKRYPRTVQKFKNAQYEGPAHHPTQKPVALMEYLIRTYTNEGETVLDFTMGSGTTGVACVNTGRNFIGIEWDETYFEIARKRIEEAKQKLPIY
jgi:site-specific DNA-methyltransferase (adenine-specific)